MARFMTEGIYNTWTLQEENNQRIVELNERDPNRPEEIAANLADVIAELLSKQHRELRTFIGQIAKAASKNMYAGIVRHSTSLE